MNTNKFVRIFDRQGNCFMINIDVIISYDPQQKILHTLDEDFHLSNDCADRIFVLLLKERCE